MHGAVRVVTVEISRENQRRVSFSRGSEGLSLTLGCGEQRRRLEEPHMHRRRRKVEVRVRYDEMSTGASRLA